MLTIASQLAYGDACISSAVLESKMLEFKREQLAIDLCQ